MDPYIYMNAVHTKAGELNGRVTWHFTQSIPAYGHITDNGVCLALTNYWIYYHTFDHLANHLGGYRENAIRMCPINTKLLREIASEQDKMQRLDSEYQKTWWLKHQLKVLGYGKGQHNIEDIRYSFSRVYGAYALVALNHSQIRSRNGHAISAYVGGGGEGALVFDPNFGEFWFDEKNDCYRFLKYLFFDIYFSRLGLNQYEFKRLWRKA